MAQTLRINAPAKDFPFDVVERTCEELIEGGVFILQKWTCDGCGKRVTSPNVNVLTHAGHCGHCNTVTNIDKRGCNYTALICPGLTLAQVQAFVSAAEAKGSAH